MVRSLCITFSFCWLVTSPLVAAEPTFPALEGKPLLDAANVISDKDEQTLNTKINNIIKKSGHQIMVFVTPSLEGQEIKEYGYQAGRHYKIGNQDSDDGIFITIAPKEHKARIDTGYGMESSITDAEATSYVREDMIPHFKENDWAGGINVGLDKVAAKIVPLTPEQQLIKQREEANRRARLQEQWNSFTDFLSWLSLIGGSIGAIFGTYLLATKKKRQEKRLEKERLAQEAEELRQQERERVYNARVRERAERALREEQLRIEKQNARSQMLAAMSPHDRALFLQKEKDDAAARAATAKQQREEQAARDQRRRSSSSSSSGYTGFGGIDYSSPSPSPSPSSSDDNFSGGGGSFGGGGGDGSW